MKPGSVYEFKHAHEPQHRELAFIVSSARTGCHGEHSVFMLRLSTRGTEFLRWLTWLDSWQEVTR
jgi:hypothetical protein